MVSLIVDGERPQRIREAWGHADSVTVMTTESGDFALQRWRVRGDVAFVETGRSVVALALGSPSPVPMSLQGTASTIWHTINGLRDSAEIAVAVADAYDTEVAVVQTEVIAFLQQLEEVGLIERHRG